MNTHIWSSLFLVSLLFVIPVFGDDLTDIYGSVPKNGVNQVTLDNSQNDREAVVVFKELTWPIPFAVYLSPHQTGVLKLPSESYQIYYSLGYGWNVTEKRFLSQPDYYMIAGVFNAGEAGMVHEEKVRPQRVVDDNWNDTVSFPIIYNQDIDYAEWKWAESTISLSPSPDSSSSVIPIDVSEFPLP